MFDSALAAPAAVACAICGQNLDRVIAEMLRDLDPRLRTVLRTLHPNWDPEAGDWACPECVGAGVQVLQHQRSPDSLHAELQFSYPVYAPDETRLLPTPVRLHANPRFTGRGVTLAFLDSGFYAHPDLVEPADRLRAYVDATLPEPAVRPAPRRAEPASWHGLMTSAVAAGNGRQSGYLYRGLAPEAELVLVKTGNRRNRRIRDRDILRALHWVVAHHAEYGVRVINISLGGDNVSTGALTPLDALVEEAVGLGLVVVAAAGNGGVNAIMPPASARSAITVGGLDDQNSLDTRFRRMWRSSYGPGVGGVSKPDLIAPAIWVAAPMLPRTWVHNEAMDLWRLEQMPDAELARFVRSERAEVRFKKETLRRPLPEVRAVIRRRIMEQKYIHPHYQHVDGTSMAAPIVTAVVAQMLEANPSLLPAQVKDLLIQTAEPLRYVPAAEQGAGVVSAARAVAAALRAPGGPLEGFPFSPRVTPAAITFYCYAPEARSVALVGSFNGWQPVDGAMWEARRGMWQIMISPPPPGTHAYKFLLDGERWLPDVENPARVEDGAGGFHSLLTLTGNP
jgi:serine protease AprX